MEDLPAVDAMLCLILFSFLKDCLSSSMDITKDGSRVMDGGPFTSIRCTFES